MPRKLVLGLVAAIAAALGLSLSLLLNLPKTIALQNGTLLETPRALPAFALTGADGKAFTNQDLAGHYTLMFTGFTSCPDICPATLTMLKAVAKKLPSNAAPLQVLFLSIDPERDTPERLKSYVNYFDANFKAATGPNQELDKLAMAMGFAYVKVPGETPATYTMDHSTALILLNPQGQVQAYFTAPHQLQMLADDLTTVLKKNA